MGCENQAIQHPATVPPVTAATTTAGTASVVSPANPATTTKTTPVVSAIAVEPGTWYNILYQTEQQKEEDAIHGISERNERTLKLQVGTFTFNSYYYYEYEAPGYKMVDQNKTTIDLEGTVRQQSPLVWWCDVTKGKFHYENLKKKAKDSGDDLVGSFRLHMQPYKDTNFVCISEVKVTKRNQSDPVAAIVEVLNKLQMRKRKE